MCTNKTSLMKFRVGGMREQQVNDTASVMLWLTDLEHNVGCLDFVHVMSSQNIDK